MTDFIRTPDGVIDLRDERGPSGIYDVHDIEFCVTCDGMRPGEWEGNPTQPMTFRCDVCSQVTEFPGGG